MAMKVYKPTESKTSREQKLLKNSGSPAIRKGLRTLREKAANNPSIAKLRDKVLAGEMTVNAALTEAGLRVPRTSLPIGDVDAAAKTLNRAFSNKELKH